MKQFHRNGERKGSVVKIVTTGATGNIGTSVLRALSQMDAAEHVVGIARRRPGFEVPKASFVEADIVTDDLAPVLQGADVVIHLAWLLQPARDPRKLHRVNVEGSRRVFEAVAKAGVPALVVASSVGAYSRGPKDRRVDETWRTDGIRTSLYSMQKVEVERELDRVERHHPSLRLVRMRPGLVFKRGAASEVRRLFVGPFVPDFLFRHIPFVPDTDRLRFQCVHSHDVGEAFALAATSGIRGAVNVAAEPVLDPERIAQALQARRVPVSANVLRWGAQTAWQLRLTPTHRGWVDLALDVPLMNTTRARSELGWEPRHTSTEALAELVDGLSKGAGMPTQPLHPQPPTARTQEGIHDSDGNRG